MTLLQSSVVGAEAGSGSSTEESSLSIMTKTGIKQSKRALAMCPDLRLLFADKNFNCLKYVLEIY